MTHNPDPPAPWCPNCGDPMPGAEREPSGPYATGFCGPCCDARAAARLADAFEQIARIVAATEQAVASGGPAGVLAALAPLSNAVLDLQVAARDARNDAADRLAAMAEGDES